MAFSASKLKQKKPFTEEDDEEDDIKSEDDDIIEDDADNDEQEDLDADADANDVEADEYEESEYDISAKIGFEHVEREPTDLEMIEAIGLELDLDLDDDDNSFLVSKDALNIHTSPYLTKYEMTKVLALRSQQILTGAPSTVPSSVFKDNKYPIDSYTIAMMELKKSRLPLIIGRRLPNNTIIRIPVHALLIPF